MVEDISHWIYTIVVIMIFVTFVEILMPNSAMKKYTKLILGFLVMTIILQPLLGYINKDYSLDIGSFKYQNQLDGIYYKKQAEDYSDKQAAAVTSLYKENLESQIEEYIAREIGHKNINVIISINEDVDSDKYGEIHNISVEIAQEDNSIKKVDKIIINSSKEEVSNNKSGEFSSLVNKISAMYDINEDKINITSKK